MKIAEAISVVDELLPNSFTPEDKVGWLSNLDARVHSQIIAAHENDGQGFAGYDDMTDQDTALLAAAPWDAMYLRWLEAMIHYHNSDDDRYNNSITLFNNAYEGFKRHYTRTHMPTSRGSFIF